MDKPENISPELIERYLKGELSAEEQQALRKAAEDDPFLADALEGFDEAREQSIDVTEHVMRIDDKVSDRTGYKKSGIVIPMNIVWRISAVAAAVLIIGGSVFIFKSINQDQQLAEGPDTEVMEESTESEATEAADEPLTDAEDRLEMEGGSAGLMDSTYLYQAENSDMFAADLNGMQGQGFLISYGKEKQEVNRFWYSPPGMRNENANGWAFEQNQKSLDNTGYLALVFETDAVEDDEILVAELDMDEEPMEVVEEIASKDMEQTETLSFGDAAGAPTTSSTSSGTLSVDDQTVIAGNLQDKKTGEVNALGGRTTTTTEEKEEVALSMEPTKDALTFSSKAKVPAEPTAYDEYFAGNYKTAATKFEDIVKDNPSDLEAKYYLGLSNFNSNKLNKAISSFDEILAQPDNLYTDGAIWYKAQSLIKKGKEDEALPLLQELSSRENSYKQSASEKIFELDD